LEAPPASSTLAAVSARATLDPSRPTAPRPAVAVDGRSADEPGDRELVREVLCVVRVLDGGDFSLMHTPGQEEELALGFLLAEGWIESTADVASLEVCEGRDTVKVRLARTPERPASQRSLVLHPSCGLCGREDAVPFLSALEPLPADGPFPLAAVRGATERMRPRQELFAATGGSHACGLFDREGEFAIVAEDIGRHAAFDKMVGRALLDGRDLARHGAALSGRASLEMVAKAARARIPLVVAVGAASEAAVDLAKRLGIALCGFARGEELVVYSGRERLR